MKPSFKLILIFSILLCSCKDDPDPDPSLPDPILSYYILYNFLSESYEVAWEIEGVVVESSQAYGIQVLSFVTLDQTREDLVFTVKESGSERVIDTATCTMEQYQYYMIAITGTEEDPDILSEPLDLELPSRGMVKLRFMQAAMNVGPVDFYIGGSSPEHKVISHLAYKDITEYIETSEEKLWESLIITPSGMPPADSILLSFTANTAFDPNHLYLGVMAPGSNSPASSLDLMLYDQPMNFNMTY